MALNAAVSTNAIGETVVVLTFDTNQSSTLVDPLSNLNGGGRFGPISLADGLYQLTIHSANVTYEGGEELNGGGYYVTPTQTAYDPTGLTLYRLFGDVDGNGVVDQLDLGQFRAANNTNEYGANGLGYAEFAYYFDCDNSGVIDQIDLGQFRQRFNSKVFT